MTAAEVTFIRESDSIKLVLAMNGETLITTPIHESVVRELHLRKVRELTIDGRFSTTLPTTRQTLDLAAQVMFDEPMAVLRFIAACAALDHSTPQPERRKRPRPELPRRKAEAT